MVREATLSPAVPSLLTFLSHLCSESCIMVALWTYQCTMQAATLHMAQASPPVTSNSLWQSVVPSSVLLLPPQQHLDGRTSRASPGGAEYRPCSTSLKVLCCNEQTELLPAPLDPQTHIQRIVGITRILPETFHSNS